MNISLAVIQFDCAECETNGLYRRLHEKGEHEEHIHIPAQKEAL
jgi:hypothetical protein